MSSVLHLREFISQRLTAAAEEIFSEFEKTIVQYEEEIDRQRRLLDITWKPRINLPTIELPKHYICSDEEVVTNEPLCKKKRNSSLDRGEPAPPQIKVEQEDLCISQEEEEEFVLKPEIDACMVTPYEDSEDSEDSEPEPNMDQPLSQNAAAAERQDEEATRQKSTQDAVKKLMKARPGNRSHADHVDGSQTSESQRVSNTTKKFIKCDFFGKNFRCKSKMKKHYVSHTNEKPYICNACGKRFSHVSTLKVHSRIHTGEGLWFCKICGRGFTRRDILRLHMRIHTGEKPYFCKTCGKSFRHSGTLTDHVRTHTGERPYSCHICWKSFTYKRGLTVHMRTHSAEKLYSCKTW
ncbi:uncharacterized protein [Leuresthes tenuis]|uniref:uncharacterized protein n=1 Tax=Leuresthes tenuis TaxID=355514 RepID=UPI003B50DBB9